MNTDHLTRLPARPAPAKPRSLRDPRRQRIDSGGTRLALELPAPVDLVPDALAVLRPRGVLRRRAGNVLDVTAQDADAVDATAWRRALSAALAALPDVDGATRPYDDLRRFAQEASPTALDEYVDAVVRAARGSLPRYVPTTAPRSQRPPRVALPPAQERAYYRERERAQEREVALWWLAGGDHEDFGFWPGPGDRCLAGDVFEQATADLGELSDGDAPTQLAPRCARVRRRVFYAALAERYGALKRDAHGARYFIVPTEQEALSA